MNSIYILIGVGIFLTGLRLFKPVQGATLWIDRTIYPDPDDYVAEFWTRVGRYLWPIYSIRLPGYDWIAVSAICAWETGYLSDPAAKTRVTRYNNIFGIEPGGSPAKYRDIGACVAYLDYMLHTKSDTSDLYREAYRVRGNGEAFIRELWKAGYNGSTSWRDGVLSIYRSVKAPGD